MGSVSGLFRAAGAFRVRFLKALQGPFGDRVWDGAGEVEGGEGVETLDVAAFPDTCYAGPETGFVLFVDCLDRFFTHVLLGSADAASRLYAGDGGVEGGTGDPECRRHAPPLLVPYYARRSEGTAGRDTKRLRFAAKLAGYGLTVVHGLP